MQVLVTNPEIDPLTVYLSAWTDRLLKDCGRKTNKYYRLRGKKVTRKNFESYLGKRAIDLVLINGHGGSDLIQGNNEVILDKDNDELLLGKTIHALSCQSAKELGVDSVEKGAKAYIGYKEDFIVFMDNSKSASRPLEDNVASIFLDPAFAAPRALLKGSSTEEAVVMAKKAYNKSIRDALNSDVQSDNDQFINWLIWDRDNLVAI